MDSKISFDVTLTLDDYRRFNFAYLYTGLRGVMTIAFGLSFLIGSIILVPSAISRGGSNAYTGWVMVFVAIYFLIFLPFSIFLRTKRMFESDKFLSEPQHYSVEADGLEVTSASSKTILAWDKIFSVRESKNYIFMYLARTKALIIPKKNIGEELDFFIRILLERIDRKKIKIAKPRV